MAQQTAVEWLADLLPYVTFLNYKKEIEQAKAMEKEQIMDARENGLIDGVKSTNNSYYNSLKTSEQYYNETYKK